MLTTEHTESTEVRKSRGSGIRPLVKPAVVRDVHRGAVSGKTVSEIGADADFPDECVITGIYRPETQSFIIPRGRAQLLSGDRVFLVAAHTNLRHASKYLHKKG